MLGGFGEPRAIACDRIGGNVAALNAQDTTWSATCRCGETSRAQLCLSKRALQVVPWCAMPRSIAPTPG
jgi:hypothetical protein